MPLPIEASYPISFRAVDAKALGDHLNHHNSVVLIGMKRVGISNFLRFFLYHPQVVNTYVNNSPPRVDERPRVEAGSHPLFIPIDLNDLVARELPAFWTLTLKRLVDAIDTPQSHELFLRSVQLQDTLFTLDCIKRCLKLISQHHYPVIFFIRFDRLANVFTPEAFANLQGLKDATHQKHSFVFTSFRPLHQLAPKVFKRPSMSLFAHDMYLKPAQPKDMQIILKTFEDRYNFKLPTHLQSPLLKLTGGHVQYLQLALIKLRQGQALDSLKTDEEIILQSEELAASFPKNPESSYLKDTGLVTPDGKIFSPLLAHYMQTKEAGQKHPDFTKKEDTLFNYLKRHLNELCERDDIISAVWPEQEELGVSDWAIDRLVARVRSKLKSQNSPYHIQTIVTRGYKLVE